MKTKYIFFRNDDVRDTLDESLVKITELFIKHKIPICHAVEPANVTPEVIDWLLKTKQKHPDLIEIVQHGYDHKLNYQKMIGGKLKRGEFGGNRTYDDQLNDIKAGKELMDKYFGDLWFPVITFPFGSYNTNTIKASYDLNYVGISSSVSYSTKSRIKDRIGNIFNQDTFWGYKISYHNNFRNKSKLFEVDISIHFIKKYIDNNEVIHFSAKEMILNINTVINRTSIIGVLLHHRYHKNELEELRNLLIYLMENDFSFSTLKKIIDEKK